MVLRRPAREEALEPGVGVKAAWALSSAMLVAYALHAHADSIRHALLAKPFSSAELLERVASMLAA